MIETWKNVGCLVFVYRKYSIRSRPCVISDPDFPRLVLEVLQKIWKEQTFFVSWMVPLGPQKHKKIENLWNQGGLQAFITLPLIE